MFTDPNLSNVFFKCSSYRCKISSIYFGNQDMLLVTLSWTAERKTKKKKISSISFVVRCHCEWTAPAHFIRFTKSTLYRLRTEGRMMDFFCTSGIGSWNFVKRGSIGAFPSLYNAIASVSSGKRGGFGVGVFREGTNRRPVDTLAGRMNWKQRYKYTTLTEGYMSEWNQHKANETKHNKATTLKNCTCTSRSCHPKTA